MKKDKKSIDFNFISNRNHQIRNLIRVLNFLVVLKSDKTTPLKYEADNSEEPQTHNNNTIDVNFKTKKRRDPEWEAMFREIFDYWRLEIKPTDHLLPPTPYCYSRDQIIWQKINGTSRKAKDHIRSCLRCKDLSMFIGFKLAEFPLYEIERKSIAEIVYELFKPF
jgi:hypothetical protein